MHVVVQMVEVVHSVVGTSEELSWLVVEAGGVVGSELGGVMGGVMVG